MLLAKQTKREWINYGAFGLPSEKEALFEGCVGDLPRSWDHPAVFLARKKALSSLKSDAFFFGVPRFVGDKRNDFAYQRVRKAFCDSYEFYCKKVRAGEELTCEANIRPYVARCAEGETVTVNEPVVTVCDKAVGDKALKEIHEMLNGHD